jgi:hypothetical protein
MAFAKDLSHTHVRLEVDNTTTVSYVNKQGGKIKALYKIALNLWEFAIARDIWLSAAHLLGSLNVHADAASRADFKYDKEWQLQPAIFQLITSQIGPVQIDMFASRINAQIDKYVAWQPDPDATAIDAFSLNWSSCSHPFFFPPFSLLGRTVQKLATDHAEGIVVAPVWPTQPWYSTLMRMATHTPRLLRHPQLLRLPHKPHLQHPLSSRLKLIVCHVSGKPSQSKGSNHRREPSFSPLGV